MRSSLYIEAAAQVLKKYTLDIDVKPFRAPADFAAAFKGKIADAKKGMLKSAGSYYITGDAGGPDAWDPLRKEIGTPGELSRLIVVFAALTGTASGFTVLKPDWLPWVIVDPRVRKDPDPSDAYTAIHEFGHACRLVHCLNSWEPNATMTPDPDYLANLMLNSTGLGYLWGWQVDEIFDFLIGAMDLRLTTGGFVPEAHTFICGINRYRRRARLDCRRGTRNFRFGLISAVRLADWQGAKRKICARAPLEAASPALLTSNIASRRRHGKFRLGP